MVSLSVIGRNRACAKCNRGKLTRGRSQRKEIRKECSEKEDKYYICKEK